MSPFTGTASRARSARRVPARSMSQGLPGWMTDTWQLSAACDQLRVRARLQVGDVRLLVLVVGEHARVQQRALVAGRAADGLDVGLVRIARRLGGLDRRRRRRRWRRLVRLRLPAAAAAAAAGAACSSRWCCSSQACRSRASSRSARESWMPPSSCNRCQASRQRIAARISRSSTTRRQSRSPSSTASTYGTPLAASCGGWSSHSSAPGSSHSPQAARGTAREVPGVARVAEREVHEREGDLLA